MFVNPVTVTVPRNIVAQRMGSEVTFSCTVSGGPDIAITWFHETELSGGGRFSVDSSASGNDCNVTVTSALTIHQTEVEDSGTYECRTPYSRRSATLSVLSKQSRITRASVHPPSFKKV